MNKLFKKISERPAIPAKHPYSELAGVTSCDGRQSVSDNNSEYDDNLDNLFSSAAGHGKKNDDSV